MKINQSRLPGPDTRSKKLNTKKLVQVNLQKKLHVQHALFSAYRMKKAYCTHDRLLSS